MKTLILSTLALATLAAQANAADRIVDASGASSSYTTIDQALAASAAGDRILVLPGSYPAFHFSRGVEVIGMGLRPTDVQVARVDFHPTIPTTGFRCALSNLSVCGTGSSDGTSIGGNELAEGVLVVEGVTTCGGVYLHGAGQFYLMVFDSHVESAPGGGFQNAAFDFGGGEADIVGTRILGAPASAVLGIPAGLGLREQAGATVRVSDSVIRGGGGVEGLTSLWNGGDGIAQGAGPGGGASLRLSGGASVEGGAAFGAGTAGVGVNLAASASVRLGDASVHGGFGACQPASLGYDPELSLSPMPRYALGDTFLRPGDGVHFVLDASLPAPALGWSITLPPAQMRWVPDPSLGLYVPRLCGGGNPPPSSRRYYQAFFTDPYTGQLVSTNPVAITIDR